jgi:1-acyl-sn-glycerol-3-phosphate acyltransferase
MDKGTIFYTVLITIARLFFTLFASWHVEGRENVPRRGPLIVVSNHRSYGDPPVVGASIPRGVYFLGKRGLFDTPILGRLLHWCGVYPIDRNGRDVHALKWAQELLRRDGAVVLFPEGTRNPRGMRAALPGVTYLALKTQASILPVGITGTEKITNLWRLLFPLCRIRVRIGQPFSLPVIEGDIPRVQMEELTGMIMGRVADMIPPEYRGIYGFKRDAVSGSESTFKI